ncbi:hypothetical protein Tco_1156155 [Tanacetum coccineum]
MWLRTCSGHGGFIGYFTSQIVDEGFEFWSAWGCGCGGGRPGARHFENGCPAFSWKLLVFCYVRIIFIVLFLGDVAGPEWGRGILREGVSFSRARFLGQWGWEKVPACSDGDFFNVAWTGGRLLYFVLTHCGGGDLIIFELSSEPEAKVQTKGATKLLLSKGVWGSPEREKASRMGRQAECEQEISEQLQGTTGKGPLLFITKVNILFVSSSASVV